MRTEVMYPELNIPQAQFLASKKKYSLFLGDTEAAKLWVGCAGLAQHFWRHPGITDTLRRLTRRSAISFILRLKSALAVGLTAKVRAGNEVHAEAGGSCAASLCADQWTGRKQSSAL